MIKLIHISDIHLHPKTILGSDPIANFQACIKHIDTCNNDADMVVITGDLTHHGRQSSYEELKQILSNWKRKPFLMIGNHDNREIFKTVFPETPTDQNGYIQYTHDTDLGRLVFLDTVETGEHKGHFGADRRAWLRDELTKASEEKQAVYLFMHHNPVDTGIINADVIGLIEDEAFREILADYNTTIRHIFFGHCHYILSGSVCGVPFSAPRSTSHPNAPDFSGIDRMGYGDISPTYNVCLLNEASAVVHSIDFLNEDKIIWEMSGADISEAYTGPGQEEGS